MSWLASFEVLPSPNHVLAKLAIFRGAEPSPHSPRATDSQSLCSTIILNPSLSSSRSLTPSPPPPLPPRYAPLVHRFHPPVVFLTTSAPRHPPTRSGFLCSPFLSLAHLATHTAVFRSIPRSLLLSLSCLRLRRWI